MKKIFIAFVTILLLASCDVIKQDDRYLEIDVPQASDRVVLLMDFTGWKCVNCPDAAKAANGILSMYPENCIVVSMHPEGMTFTEPGAEGPDFASSQAMEYLKAFGGSVSTSLPQGIVDMRKYQGEYLNTYDKWAPAVYDRIGEPANYSISLTADTGSFKAKVSLVDGNPTGSERLLIWLVEDSIVGRQLTKDGELDDYMHRHVFRGCLNGTGIWGDEVSFAFSSEDELYGEYSLPALQGAHFIVVALLVDGDTHEVLQATEQVLGVSHELNPGFFTIKDAANEIEYHDGDTIRTSHFNAGSGEMEFDGYINIDSQSDVEFYIDEERDFAADVYYVSLCILNLCRADMNDGHWGPFAMQKGQSYDFQSHVAIPEEEQGEPHTFTTSFRFSNGNPEATKTIVVVYEYTPSN